MLPLLDQLKTMESFRAGLSAFCILRWPCIYGNGEWRLQLKSDSCIKLIKSGLMIIIDLDMIGSRII